MGRRIESRAGKHWDGTDPQRIGPRRREIGIIITFSEGREFESDDRDIC